jgi:hypothetical protein
MPVGIRVVSAAVLFYLGAAVLLEELEDLGLLDSVLHLVESEAEVLDAWLSCVQG